MRLVFVPSASPPVIIPEQKKIKNETYRGVSSLLVTRLNIKKNPNTKCNEASNLKNPGFNFFPVNTNAREIMLDKI